MCFLLFVYLFTFVYCTFSFLHTFCQSYTFLLSYNFPHSYTFPHLHTFLLSHTFCHSYSFLLSYANLYFSHSVPLPCKLLRLNSGAWGEHFPKRRRCFKCGGLVRLWVHGIRYCWPICEGILKSFEGWKLEGGSGW